MHLCKYVIILLFFSSCSSNLEDFRREGKTLSHLLVQDLKQVHTRGELVVMAPTLKKKIEKLVDLMIKAKQHQLKHPEEVFESREENFSEELLEELRRIYALDGGRETMERIEHEALLRLDAFNRSLLKSLQK